MTASQPTPKTIRRPAVTYSIQHKSERFDGDTDGNPQRRTMEMVMPEPTGETSGPPIVTDRLADADDTEHDALEIGRAVLRADRQAYAVLQAHREVVLKQRLASFALAGLMGIPIGVAAGTVIVHLLAAVIR